ncbi:MAG: hypothetical protein IJH07_04130 [Ruminococcus sp.]|nr:hypothetical protein [Ruminococcus sp.]
MIKNNELRRRVDVRKRELDSQNTEFIELHEKLTNFVEDIKKRSVIYNLVKNLSVWQEIEKLL